MESLSGLKTNLHSGAHHPLRQMRKLGLRDRWYQVPGGGGSTPWEGALGQLPFTQTQGVLVKGVILHGLINIESGFGGNGCDCWLKRTYEREREGETEK